MAIIARNSTGWSCLSNFRGVPITTTSAEYFPGYWAWRYAGKPLKCPTCGRGIGLILDVDLDPINGRGQAAGTDTPLSIERGIAHA